MRVRTALFMVTSLLLATLLLMAPAAAQKPAKPRKPKPPPPPEEILMVAFRGASGDRVVADFPVEGGVYLDGDEGTSIFFGSSGNMMFEIQTPKKINPGDPTRKLTLDFTDLHEPLVGDEVRPDFAYGPLTRPSGLQRRERIYFFVAPDDGEGNPFEGGLRAMSVGGGYVPARIPLFFSDDEGSLWRLTWSQPDYTDRGTGFAVLECKQEDTGGCVAWTVQFTNVAYWAPGVNLPLDRPLNTTGNAVLWNNFDNRPDGGVYVMPFKMAICLKPQVEVAGCYDLTQ